MRIPKNMTEEEVIDVVNRVVHKVASAFRFGYYSYEDLVQEGWVEAIELLAKKKYDEVRPLEKLLLVHIKRRLSNLKRNKYKRNDPPCTVCHNAFLNGKASKCKKKENGKTCERYRKWVQRNTSKQNLMDVLGLSTIDEDNDCFTYIDTTSELNPEINELLDILDENLSLDDRKNLLKLRAGEYLSEDKKQELRTTVCAIFAEKGVEIGWH